MESLKNTLILFRVDASRKGGMGHLMRCKHIASFLKKDGYEVLFLSKKSRVLKDFPYPVYFLKDGIKYLKEALKKLKPYLIICDIKDAPPHYMQTLKEGCKYLLALDNNSASAEYADIVINAIGKRENKVYKKGKTLFFEGLKFIVLHPSFLAHKEGEREGIVISVGGTDPGWLTLKILDALSGINEKKRVVIGHGFSKSLINAIKKKAKEDENIHFLIKPDSLAPYFLNAALIISCGGITMYEAIASLCPTIVVCQNEEQLRNAESVEDAIIKFGFLEEDKKEMLAEKASLLLYNKEIREKLQEACRKTLDKKGILRVLNIIKKFKRREDEEKCHKNRGTSNSRLSIDKA